VTIAARNRSNRYVKVPPAHAGIGVNRNCGMESTFGQLGVALGRLPLHGAIQIAARLDLP
jgi:hypothetical protein